MTDKKLLELAAKAAGYDWYGFGQRSNQPDWNPLTDDGDALRLAVKLNFTIDRGEVSPSAWVYCDYRDIFVEAVEYHENDPYAATRRAIVRAAAEIGKTL